MAQTDHALPVESPLSVPLTIPGPGQALSGARRWLWTAVIVALLVLFVTTLWYFNAVKENPNASWSRLLVGVSFEWFPWAIFAPLIALLVARFPFERDRLIRSGSAHLAMAILAALVQNGSAVLGSLLRSTAPITAAKFLANYQSYLLWMAPWSIVIYFGIAAIIAAGDYRTRLIQREWLASRLEAELTRAQLNTLYSQLQPHFLFNTLNSISVLMSIERINEAQVVLRQLSELLRYVLVRGESQQVSVADETSFVEKYLAIEKTRFAERLTYSLTVDPAVRNAMIPTFLLQTLVENAVRHGVSPKVSGGQVTIVVAANGNQLTIQVDDDGVGIAPDLPPRGSGVGLRNARGRLEHLFGEEFVFELKSRPQGGTSAYIAIPLTEN
ncbi:MAG: histidine kinase [Candidatus Zixiibacteriota bacterium]